MLRSERPGSAQRVMARFPGPPALDFRSGRPASTRKLARPASWWCIARAAPAGWVRDSALDDVPHHVPNAVRKIRVRREAVDVRRLRPQGDTVLGWPARDRRGQLATRSRDCGGRMGGRRSSNFRSAFRDDLGSPGPPRGLAMWTPRGHCSDCSTSSARLRSDRAERGARARADSAGIRRLTTFRAVPLRGPRWSCCRSPGPGARRQRRGPGRLRPPPGEHPSRRSRQAPSPQAAHRGRLVALVGRMSLRRGGYLASPD
jgi:hypothetical protein